MNYVDQREQFTFNIVKTHKHTLNQFEDHFPVFFDGLVS